MNRKRVRLRYRLDGLQLRMRVRRRKHQTPHRVPAPVPTAATLDRVLATGNKPRSITVDHGTAFTSRALEDWAYARGVALDVTPPGKPTDNGHVESSNGRLRD